nr:radical SAM protein [Pseudophaeobacter sp. EL27]
MQATVGCTHNKCTFCSMYKEKKFHTRKTEEILADLQTAKARYHSVKRIFLADGDALALSMNRLRPIFEEIAQLFPDLEGVGIYARATGITRKSHEDLMELNALGLDIIYMGFETGDEDILLDIKKNETTEDLIAAGQKVKETPIFLLATMLNGIGGQEKWQDHALNSAKILNQVQPNFIGLSALLKDPDAPMYAQIESGEFQLLTPVQILQETKLILENLEIDNCIFSTQHAINYLSMQGVIPRGRDKLMETLDKGINDPSILKDDSRRRL